MLDTCHHTWSLLPLLLVEVSKSEQPVEKDELAEESSSPLAEDIFFVLNQVLKFLATLTISVLSVQHKVRSNRQIGFNQSSKPR